jgi:hypothetical protein
MDVVLASDPGYWDRAPERLRWAQVGARAMDQDLALHVLGDEANEAAAVIELLRMPPGYVLSRHHHSTWRFEILLQGSVTIGELTLRPGDIFITRPDEDYGPLTAGPDGVTSLEMFSASDGVDATFDMSTVDDERLDLMRRAARALKAQGRPRPA